MKAKFFLLQMLCLCFTMINAQTNLYNSGTLTLSSSADVLYISGNFTNVSSASLTNNGQLYVLKDLDNSQASMTVATGKLYLNGSTAQTVSGSQPFKTYDFISDN